MTTPDIVRTWDAIANRRPLITGLTTALRRSALVEAQPRVELDGAVDGVVRLIRDLQPS